MNPKKIAFLGAGNMATAIIHGILAANAATQEETICIYDKEEEKYQVFADKKFYIAPSASAAVAFADYIVLAVKPQNYKELLMGIRDSNVSLENKVFVSIAAGIPTKSVCNALGQAVPVIRTMPNTPLLIGKGVTALSQNEWVEKEDFTQICDIFSASGATLLLPEDQMNAIISVTSSSPAYVYLFIKAIFDAAQAQGLDQENLLSIICNMVIGSAEMVLQSGKTPDELIRMVTSPNGTTERAMHVLKECGLEKMIYEAMYCCTDRAEELSKEME